MPPTRTVRGPLSLAFAALETLISDQDSAYIDDPCTVRRTIFVPADSVLPLDFDLPEKEQKALYDRGVQAAQHFLETWNYTDYLIACRGAASPSPPV
jgi:NTE family protein